MDDKPATETTVIEQTTNDRALDHLAERVGLLEEALRRIEEWSRAYPLTVFPEPDEAYYAKAHEVLKANGVPLDRLSAAAIRHVMKGVGKIAREALEMIGETPADKTNPRLAGRLSRRP